MENEFKVPVSGGYLVAGRNPDRDYDGIWITFESNDGYVIDIVNVESPTEDNKEVTNVYCYEDVYTDQFTRKYTINHKEIYKALEEEWK